MLFILIVAPSVEVAAKPAAVSEVLDISDIIQFIEHEKLPKNYSNILIDQHFLCLMCCCHL